MSEERFDGIDRRFNEVDRQFGEVDRRLEVLTAETIDLRRHMGVLHEDVIDRIRGIREDDSLRQEMRAGFAMIMRRLDDHAIPGEAADRTFAATLSDHEKRITSLERTKS